MMGLLWGIIGILVVIWIILLALKITFWGIHMLLLAAVVLFVINLIMGRRSA